jgi:hypothetical protein
MNTVKLNAGKAGVIALTVAMILDAGAVSASDPGSPSLLDTNWIERQQATTTDSWNLHGIDISQIERGENFSRLAVMGSHFRSGETAEEIGHLGGHSLFLDLQERILDIPKRRKEMLGEINDIAGGIAKGWAENLTETWKKSSPNSYLGAVAGGAAVLGTYGYLEGSEGLEALGIKPKFESFGLMGSIVTRWNLGDAGHIRGSFSFSDQRTQEVSFGYQLDRPESDLSLTLAGRYDLQSERVRGAASLRYQPATNMELTCSGSVDSEGKSQIGVGFTWQF